MRRQAFRRPANGCSVLQADALRGPCHDALVPGEVCRSGKRRTPAGVPDNFELRAYRLGELMLARAIRNASLMAVPVQIRRVPDVVQPRCGFNEFGVRAENQSQASGFRGHALRVPVSTSTQPSRSWPPTGSGVPPVLPSATATTALGDRHAAAAGERQSAAATRDGRCRCSPATASGPAVFGSSQIASRSVSSQLRSRTGPRSTPRPEPAPRGKAGARGGTGRATPARPGRGHGLVPASAQRPRRAGRRPPDDRP
jgi:hypothetical protein